MDYSVLQASIPKMEQFNEEQIRNNSDKNSVFLTSKKFEI